MNRHIAYGCSGVLLPLNNQEVTGCSGSLFNPNTLNPDPNYFLNGNGTWVQTQDNKPKQCECCGARGQVYKCDYCGTRL